MLIVFNIKTKELHGPIVNRTKSGHMTMNRHVITDLYFRFTFKYCPAGWICTSSSILPNQLQVSLS